MKSKQINSISNVVYSLCKLLTETPVTMVICLHEVRNSGKVLLSNFWAKQLSDKDTNNIHLLSYAHLPKLLDIWRWFFVIWDRPSSSTPNTYKLKKLLLLINSYYKVYQCRFKVIILMQLYSFLKRFIQIHTTEDIRSIQNYLDW